CKGIDALATEVNSNDEAAFAQTKKFINTTADDDGQRQSRCGPEETWNPEAAEKTDLAISTAKHHVQLPVAVDDREADCVHDDAKKVDGDGREGNGEEEIWQQ